MPHFFITEQNIIDKNIITVNDKENYTHIVKSLRVKIGEEIKFCDEKETLYRCKVKNITKNELISEIQSSSKSERKLDYELILAQTPLRSDAQLLLVEKATELGVSEIYPIYTKNCALAQNIASAKVEKWQKIMYEASKQCERANIPKCNQLTTLKNLPFDKFDKIIVFAERNEEMSLKEYILNNPIKTNEKILAIIGPEGGFSDEEFEFFKENKLPLVTLGKLILKAETATIVALGNLIYGYSK